MNAISRAWLDENLETWKAMQSNANDSDVFALHTYHSEWEALREPCEKIGKSLRTEMGELIQMLQKCARCLLSVWEMQADVPTSACFQKVISRSQMAESMRRLWEPFVFERPPPPEPTVSPHQGAPAQGQLQAGGEEWPDDRDEVQKLREEREDQLHAARMARERRMGHGGENEVGNQGGNGYRWPHGAV